MPSSEEQIALLAEEIASCNKCPRAQTRSLPLVGEGTISAKIMVVGEAPGKQEDQQGRPFVGQAGKIFDQLLDHVKLFREQIYITNILKCHPPNNRDPADCEVIAYLCRQIRIIKPTIIITLGRYLKKYLYLLQGSANSVEG
ncbi:MAG: uracil-DNA glycosylase family protein [Chlamydiota bacterium]